MNFTKEVFPIDPLIMSIIIGVIGVVLGLLIGFNYRKHIAEAKIGVAESRAEK